MNSFFEAVLAEAEPMYDAALVTENGAEYLKIPGSNFANNSHSATKLFVATAVGILCDRGLLTLDTKVTSLFTQDETGAGTDPKWNGVTVRDCLRHKTGMDTIPYNVDNDDDTPEIGEDFLKYVFSLKIEKKTGEYRRYSDEAYYLLGRVIEKASGMDAVGFFRENLMNPLGFRQWSMALCPKGHIIGGGGFYCRSDDCAKLGLVYATGGTYEGKRIISGEWTKAAKENDYACTQFRDTGVFLKTGAHGQMVAFSEEKRTAVSWHGFSQEHGNERNDRLLEAFVYYLNSEV